MLTTPRSILLGFGLIAVAIVLQPMARNAFISPAGAISLDGPDLSFIEKSLESIALSTSTIAIGSGCKN